MLRVLIPLFLILAISEPAFAAEEEPGATTPPSDSVTSFLESGEIPGLVLSSPIALPEGLESKAVGLEGTYLVPGRTLSCEGKRILPGADGKFEAEIPFDPRKIEVGLYPMDCFSIDDFGVIQRKSFRLDVEEVLSSRRRFSYFAGGGLTFSNFRFKSTTGNRANLNQTGLTFKGGVGYQLPDSPFRFGFSTYLTPLKIWSEGSFSTAVYYGLNFRAGYRFKQMLWDRLTPEVSLGWYIWGMSRSPSSPGVENVYGPQIFATFYGSLSNHRSYSFYLKYAPLSESAVLPKLSNQETAIGGRFSPVPKSKTSLTLDLSELNGTFSDGTRELSLYTISLGIERRF